HLAVARGGARPAARGLLLSRGAVAPGTRVPWEVRAVLVLLVLHGAAVIATYSRFPASELYHVHHAGTIAAGFGRELVAINFPFALIAGGAVGARSPGR